MKIPFLILSLVTISMMEAFTQINYVIPVRGVNAVGDNETLFMGVHPNATYCIDGDTIVFSDGTKVLEYELPPAPPDPVNIDFRVINNRTGETCLGNGLKFHIRNYASATQRDTFRVQYITTLENNAGWPIKIYWPVGMNLICDSAALVYRDGVSRTQNMFLTSTLALKDVDQRIFNIFILRPKALPESPPITPVAYFTDTIYHVRPTLHWSFSVGATGYVFQVATDANFNNIVLIDSVGRHISTKRIGPLKYNTIYYWRVRAKNQYGYSAFSTAVTFRTILPSVNLIIPADSTFNLIRPVTFRWNKIEDVRYVFQLARDRNFSQLVVNDTTLVDTIKVVSAIPEDQSHYFWRVGVNIDGVLGHYASSRYFTILNIPAVPVLQYPADNDSAVSPTLNYRWRKSRDAQFYHIQISTNAEFTNIFIQDSTLTDTTKQYSMAHQTDYWWRVRARNVVGASVYSTVNKFRTGFPIPAQTILVSPVNNDTTVALEPNLMWQAVQFAYRYELMVATDSNFTSVVYQNVNLLTTSQVLPQLASNRSFFWRVRAANSTGIGPFSTTWKFKTILVPPAKTTLVSPPNNSENIIPTPTLIWNSVALAERYHLQVAIDENFNNIVLTDENLTTTSRQVGPLSSGLKHFWRVRARNSAGNGEFSDTWNFTTIPIPAPGATQLNSPPNNSKNITLNPILYWYETEFAERYRLDVSRDSLFRTFVFSDSNITTNWQKVGPLLLTTKYFWRVRAKNTVGTGPYSEVRYFTTVGDESPRWLAPFVAFETGIARDTIFFGVHPNATHGIDNHLGEYELPPILPGYFDLRWVGPPRRPYVLGAGTRVNYTPFISFSQVDTYKVRFQPGTGSYPMRLTWPTIFLRGICDSIKLIDEFGGGSINVRMDVFSSQNIDNVSISSLLIIMWNPRPLGVKVVNNIIPNDFVLYSNYPNPFNPSTNIQFSIMKPSQTSLIIYNSLGEKVTSLVDAYFYPGTYSVEWNGRDDNLNLVPSGTYFIRMTAEKFSAIKKMILMK